MLRPFWNKLLMIDMEKLAAEPTTTVGWLREWAVCAPARHEPPRGGASGERPEATFALRARDARYFIMKIVSHNPYYNTHGLVPNRPPTKLESNF